MIIDFHNHFYPPEFIEAVRQGPSNFSVTDDDEGNPILHSPGDYNVAVPGHRDIEYRTRVLDEAGVDIRHGMGPLVAQDVGEAHVVAREVVSQLGQ